MMSASTARTAVAMSLVLGLMAAMPGRAATVQCPRTIDEAPQVAEVPTPWQVVAPRGPRGLEQAAIYWGTGAADLSSLVPTDDRVEKNRQRVRWKLTPPPAHEHHWIGCMYTGTTALLVLRLDAAVSQCEVIYDLMPTGRRQRLAWVDCR